MKITTKGRYALRLMLDLALFDSEECVSLKDIAGRQEISVKYLEQIITTLHRGGMVNSARGPQGGYRLTRRPEEYTVGEILRLTTGSLVPVACMEDEPNRCARHAQCATVELFERVNEAVAQVVDHTTLADLLVLHRAKELAE